MGDVRQLWEENATNNTVIKILSENLNTVTTSLYKSSNTNTDKSFKRRLSHRYEYKIQNNTAATSSLYQN